MPFLALNGFTVPVAIGGEETPEVIGSGIRRSHTGAPLSDARAYKRKWRFTTPPLTEQLARSLIGMIQGKGIHIPFSSQSAYASNGLGYTGGVLSYHGDAADGRTTYDLNDVTMEKFGESGAGYSAAIESGTTNVLYAIATNGPNICTGTDSLGTTGGFTSVNTSTLTSDTTVYWQGSRSLKIVCTSGATTDGAQTSFATVASNATVTGSVYLYAATAVSVTIDLQQNSGAPATLAGSILSHTLNAGAWTRVSTSGTLTGGNTTVRMRIYETSAAANITFFADGLQIEALAYPTSWVAGTRAAPSHYYSGFDSSWKDYTLGAWVLMPTTSPSAQGVLLMLYDSSTTYGSIYRSAGTNAIKFDALPGGSVTYSTNPWDNNWHHVMGVVRINTETGESNVTLYFDGASVGTPDTSITYTGMSSSTVLYVGNNAGSTPANQARITHVRCVPYAMTAAQVLALYTLGNSSSTGAGSTPKIRASGDFITDTFINVIGEVNAVTYKPHMNAGAWRTNGQHVDFTLYEV